MTLHSSLTGANLHEPKGVASAAANQVYVANGSGSGVWTTVNNLNKVFLTYTLDDISTAGSEWVVPGIAGQITKINTVLHGAIGTANAGLTFEIGGAAVTDGAVTITQSGSAAGDIDTATPSGTNTFTNAQAIEIIKDGASTNTVKVTITFELDVS